MTSNLAVGVAAADPAISAVAGAAAALGGALLGAFVTYRIHREAEKSQARAALVEALETYLLALDHVEEDLAIRQVLSPRPRAVPGARGSFDQKLNRLLDFLLLDILRLQPLLRPLLRRFTAARRRAANAHRAARARLWLIAPPEVLQATNEIAELLREWQPVRQPDEWWVRWHSQRRHLHSVCRDVVGFDDTREAHLGQPASRELETGTSAPGTPK